MPSTSFNPALIAFDGSRQATVPLRGVVTYAGQAFSRMQRQIRSREVAVSITAGAEAADDQPLISCLMLTRDRFEQALLAARCFQKQTWLKRELVIVDSGEDDRFARWVTDQNDPALRLISVPGSRETLGDLRNRSVENARGDYVATWDDDDLHHPLRLQAQMALMAEGGADAGVLSREVLWLPRQKRLAVSHIRPHENTLVCRRSAMPAYPSLDKMEDTPLVEALLRSHEIALLDQPELYVYVAHGGNTWPGSHLERLWHEASERFESVAYFGALAQLSRCHPTSEYQKLISARDAVG